MATPVVGFFRQVHAEAIDGRGFAILGTPPELGVPDEIAVFPRVRWANMADLELFGGMSSFMKRFTSVGSGFQIEYGFPVLEGGKILYRPRVARFLLVVR